jgi:Na+/H+ antiporter NhaC
MQYAPWALFNYLNPFVALVFAFTGFHVERIEPSDAPENEAGDVPRTESPPAA